MNLRDIAKAGYGLMTLLPSPIANAAAQVCGTRIPYLPKFVKEGYEEPAEVFNARRWRELGVDHREPA